MNARFLRPRAHCRGDASRGLHRAEHPIEVDMRSTTYALLSVLIATGGILANACSSQPASSGLSQDDQTATDPTSATNTPSGTGATSSSTPAPAATAADAAPPPATDGGVVDPDAGIPAADAALPPPVQQDCSATTSYDACGQCCDANNPPGYQVAEDAFTACICTMPGVCAQACGGSLCAGQDPSGQCQQCLNSNKAQQCEDAADTACQASPACAASEQCFQQSSCDQKP
jgi:hypothetical protein